MKKLKSNLPQLVSGKQNLAQELYKPLWKHGTKLATRFNSFTVDKHLVSKHLPALEQNKAKIESLLAQTVCGEKKCELTSLYTHPKLMRSYYFKGERDLSR